MYIFDSERTPCHGVSRPADGGRGRLGSESVVFLSAIPSVFFSCVRFVFSAFGLPPLSPSPALLLVHGASFLMRFEGKSAARCSWCMALIVPFVTILSLSFE